MRTLQQTDPEKTWQEYGRGHLDSPFEAIFGHILAWFVGTVFFGPLFLAYDSSSDGERRFMLTLTLAFVLLWFALLVLIVVRWFLYVESPGKLIGASAGYVAFVATVMISFWVVLGVTDDDLFLAVLSFAVTVPLLLLSLLVSRIRRFVGLVHGPR